MEKLGELRQAGGYETITQGLEQAVDHHLLELRRQRAEKVGKKIRKNGVTPKTMLLPNSEFCPDVTKHRAYRA